MKGKIFDRDSIHLVSLLQAHRNLPWTTTRKKKLARRSSLRRLALGVKESTTTLLLLQASTMTIWMTGTCGIGEIAGKNNSILVNG